LYWCFVTCVFRYEDEISRLKGEPVPERPSLPLVGPSAPGQLALSSLQGAEKRNSSTSSLEEMQRNVRPRESSTGSVTSTSSSAPAVYDWLASYNPKSPRTISINLTHTINFEGVVCCVRVSHSGKLLALSGNRMCSIFDTLSGSRLLALPHENGAQNDLYVRSLSFSPEDEFFATGSEDNLIRVWALQDLLTAARESQPAPPPSQFLRGHSKDVYTLEFINKNELISGSGDETLRIWDIKTGDCKNTIKIDASEKTAGKDSAITSLAVSHSRRYVAACSLDKLVRVWDLQAETPVLIQTLSGHTDSIYSVCFNHSDSEIISGALDKTVRRWSFAQPGHCLQVLSGHKDFVLSVAVCGAKNEFIVSASKDRSVQLWDMNSQSLQVTLQGHKNSVISVAVNPMGGSFATGSGDGRARIWSFAEKQEN
jgi:glucose repression regulatory protein TUP1